MIKNHFVSGEWNVTCDVCSRKIKSSLAKERWDGFIVCPDDYETRHPQDFIQARQDKITVPFTRPIPDYVFVDVPYICMIDDRRAIVGIGLIGCTIIGNT